MTLTVEERAKVLVEALPYIKRFHGQIVVIKVGGNAIDHARDEALLGRGYIPVIASIGLGYDGHAYNINADTVAAEIAVALNAAKVILLTDVAGVLGADGEVVAVLSREDARQRMEKGEVTGGMIPKLEACLRALDGVPLAHIVDGRTKHALLLELFTEAGIGTMVTP